MIFFYQNIVHEFQSYQFILTAPRRCMKMFISMKEKLSKIITFYLSLEEYFIGT